MHGSIWTENQWYNNIMQMQYISSISILTVFIWDVLDSFVRNISFTTFIYTNIPARRHHFQHSYMYMRKQ